MNRLELRPLPMIALAYVLGPLVGLNVWWFLKTGGTFGSRDLDPNGVMTSWGLTLIIGGLACLLIELVLVSPLLVAFKRYGWPWLNGWTAAAIGFLLGAVPWLLLAASGPSPSPDQIPGSTTVCADGHCASETWPSSAPAVAPGRVWEINGHWTSAGWAHVVWDAALIGMIGLIAAIVFRLVAVRTAQPSQA
jgi:hypothetical protein